MNPQSKKKILVFGNHWHGNFSKFLCANLRALGHNVEEIDLLARKFSGIRGRFEKHFFIKKINTEIQEKIRTGDFDMTLGSTPFYITDETWEVINKNKIPSVVWFGDNPMWKPGLLGNIREYNAMFLPEEEWVRPVKLLNNRTEYLPHAADEAVFYPLIKSPKTIDVLFVAHAYPQTADGFLRARMISYLIQEGVKVALYGGEEWRSYCKRFPEIREVMVEKAVGPEELNALYNSSKIALNIHHTQLFAGTNQRTFEVASSETLLVCDYKKAIKDVFGDVDITFSSPVEAKEKILYYLNHADERARVAKKLREVVLAGHTYKHRISAIFEKLGTAR